MDHLFGGLWHDGSQCFVVFYLHTSCLEWYVYKYLLWWTGVEIWRSNCIGFIVTVQILCQQSTPRGNLYLLILIPDTMTSSVKDFIHLPSNATYLLCCCCCLCKNVMCNCVCWMNELWAHKMLVSIQAKISIRLA
jgi:hypothetical protein